MQNALDQKKNNGADQKPVVIITGGSSGIGLACAQNLLQNGYIVVICSRNKAALQDAWEQLGSVEDCIWYQADMSVESQSSAVVNEVFRQFCRIDALVCSHGIFPQPKIFTDIDMDDWHQSINVNLFGVIHICKAAATHMTAQNYGNIVIISSVNGFHAGLYCSTYNVAKGALISLTQSLAYDLSEFGIKVNCIAPGFVRTPMTESSYQQLKDKKIEGNIVRRIGAPEEIASWVLFLVSSKASYMTGETIVVDGGQRARLSPFRAI